jgi:hypothetical protein
LLNTSRNSSKSEDSALFLNMTWNAAGQAAGCRGQNEKEKSKTSPNLGVGLPKFSTLGSLREQYFEVWSQVLPVQNRGNIFFSVRIYQRNAGL